MLKYDYLKSELIVVIAPMWQSAPSFANHLGFLSLYHLATTLSPFINLFFRYYSVRAASTAFERFAMNVIFTDVF